MSFPLHVHGRPSGLDATLLGRVSFEERPLEERGDSILAIDGEPRECPTGYAGVLTTGVPGDELLAAWQRQGVAAIHQVRHLDHLRTGDVVALHPNGYVRTLYRIASSHNAIFATDRCNSFCLMCSQPPKPVDDRDRIVEHLRLVDLIDPATRELGITGGEPTLLGVDFLRLVARCKERLGGTALHVLSNGRLFQYGGFARALAEIEHPDLMIGVPVYSDLDVEHDHVVQARGAFHETAIGLQNLGRFGVAVEIRIVLHRLTVPRLVPLVEFVYRNFSFAAHVALMGLEPMGFAVPNLDQLWIDPHDYRGELREATMFLARRGIAVSIYNVPLCLLHHEVWPYSRRSISDWKNDYLPICGDCSVRNACCGFFSSSLRRRMSVHVEPVRQAARS